METNVIDLDFLFTRIIVSLAPVTLEMCSSKKKKLQSRGYDN